MPEKILFSFVGAQDPFRKEGGDGPILAIVNARKDFTRVILFHTTKPSYIKDGAAKTASILRKRHPDLLADIYPLDIDDPTSYKQLLSTMRQILATFEENRQNDDEYFVSLASGTAPMHASWLLLTASFEFVANLLYLRHPQFVKKGQPLISEINPRSKEFPRIEHNITMDDLPNTKSIDFEKLLSNIGIIGKSESLLSVIKKAENIAAYESTVIIAGESGTGKELLAKLIHTASKRSKKPFEPINCGTIHPELVESKLFGHVKGAFTGAIANRMGIFQRADGGTIFLDEIGELAPATQVKLLRVLQEREICPVGDDKIKKVDVRVIAASNRDLQIEVKERRFRNDLYWRLNVHTLKLPPLRERKSDIKELALYFLKKLNKEYESNKSFSTDTLTMLLQHNWPGNIRELEFTIKRGYELASTETIKPNDLNISQLREHGALPDLPDIYEGFSLENHLSQLRDNLYIAALEKTGYKQNNAAKLLGVSAAMVCKYLKKLTKVNKN